jgi:hypothetical protein
MAKIINLEERRKGDARFSLNRGVGKVDGAERCVRHREAVTLIVRAGHPATDGLMP